MIKMSNSEFIKKYGFQNFKDLGEVIYLKLMELKKDERLKGYRILSNRKGKAQLFLNDGTSEIRDFAYIWSKY